MKIAVAMLVMIAVGADLQSVAAQSPQAEMQRRLSEWHDQRYRLIDRADAAWDREMAREKAGDCIATNSRDELDCLGKEVEATADNLKEYSAAFHSIFALAAPNEADWQFSGPTGRPRTAAEMASLFDDVEAVWEKYRNSLCSAAFGQDQGGTIAPISAAFCELRAMRNHMRELGAILGGNFHR
jgi:uncharacterized protein YecT (DUF1311 family)